MIAAQPSSPPLRMRLWGDFAMLSLIVMEAFWVTDWYDALGHPQAGWIAADIFITTILLATHVLARFSANWKISIRRRRFVFFMWLLVLISISFPLLMYTNETMNLSFIPGRIFSSFFDINTDLGVFWHLLIMVLIIYRGLRLAREPLQLYSVQASFQLGLFLLLLYGLVFGWEHSGQAIITTYGFLFSAVLAISATRISTLSELRGGRLPPLQPVWLVGMLAVASIVVGIGVGIGWLSTNILNEAIAVIYMVIFTILIIAGLILLSPLILVILSMGPTISDLLEALSHIPAFDNILKFVASIANQVGITPEWVEGAARTSRPLILLAILLGIVALFLMAVVWKPWRHRLIEEGTASNLQFQAALRFPSLLFGRLRGRMPTSGRMMAAARIRFVYTQLMELCARLNQPRPTSTTPLEFLPTTQALFPGADHTLEIITQAYIKVRYGELPETYEEVQQVLMGWEQLKIQGRKIHSANRRKLRKL
jgi:hypothetical protein